MRRREVLGVGGSALLGGLSGCLLVGGGSSDTVEGGPPWRRDGEVYYPGHRVGMEMIGTAQQGDLTVGLSYSYPAQFWTIAGTRRNRVGRDDKDSLVHLMASVWDTETGTVFPVASGLRISLEKDGESITQRSLWPMLTQNMGFHYGDNIRISEWGEHTITVEIGSTNLQRRGGLEGTFEETGSVSFDFYFLLTKRNDIPIERVPGRRGDHAAVAPMEMPMQPLSFAPTTAELPGRHLGQATSSDGVFVLTHDGSSLVVSPRTPFNRFVLPLMSLSARVERDGQAVFDGPLTPSIDPTRRYHYRGAVGSIEAGDTITITVDSPPQTARHSGYESAFLDMPEMTITV